jgi:hypothetical protein
MCLALLTLQVLRLTIDGALFSLVPVIDSFKCSITSGFKCPNLRFRYLMMLYYRSVAM